MDPKNDRFSFHCICRTGMECGSFFADRVMIGARCCGSVVRLPDKDGESARRLSFERETSRLKLILAEPRDWKLLLPMFAGKENHHYEISAPEDKKTLIRSLKQCQFPRGFKKSFSLRFRAVLKETAETIGTVSLTTEPLFLTGVIGFMFHHPFWGRGFGTEAVTEIMKFGFEEMNFHRMEAACDDQNEVCIRLLRRVGFEDEGCIRHWVYHPERGWVNRTLFGKLNPAQI